MIIARRPSAAALADRVAFLVAGRIADIGPEYEALFNIRSAYVHDRRMNAISTDERHRARRLARRAVTALLEAACRGQGQQGREAFLLALI